MWQRETGKPFAEACGGREAAGGVCGLRTKGVSSSRSTTSKSTLPGPAADRRGGAAEADAGAGARASALRLPIHHREAATGGLARESETGLPVVASRGAESAEKEAKAATFGQERECLPSSSSGTPRPRLVLGFYFRSNHERQPAEVALDRR